MGSFSLLSDWKTVQCDFPPTFKVARAKRAEEYNPKRIPSYTDRILFKSFPGFRDRLDTFAYDSAPGFTSSDHKPIRGMFEIAPSPSVQFASEGGESAGGNAAANGKKGKSAAQATLPEIVFSHIEAKDIPVMDPEALGVGGKADPYIKFYTDPPEMLVTKNKQHQVKSKTKMRTQFPEWDEEMVIKLNVEEEEGLDGAHMFLQIMDYDWGGSDDLIGTVTLSISQMVKEQVENGSFTFRRPIIKYGLPRGMCSGRGRFEIPDGAGHRFSGLRQEEGVSLGCSTGGKFSIM